MDPSIIVKQASLGVVVCHTFRVAPFSEIISHARVKMYCSIWEPFNFPVKVCCYLIIYPALLLLDDLHKGRSVHLWHLPSVCSFE